MYIVSFDIGIRNLAYCILDVDVDRKAHSILVWRKIDLQAKRNDLQGLVEALIALLDVILYEEIPNPFGATITVLIEYQMTAIMKCLQTAVCVYFKTTMKYNTALDLSTSFVSPKLKLKLMAQYPEFVLTTACSTSKYKQNKVDSVAFATWLLTDVFKDMRALEVLATHKKTDDLSDVYLQALAWMSAYKSI
jgi:hypothetical protein